ncbi:MAG: MerR family transcriptional regulator [Anaerolineales bacterium]
MNTLEQTPTYNLGVVVQETGINPDTLRAWERRYGLPEPERTEGGHRLYSRRDIETVKWLMARQEEGLRISQAVKLWQEIIEAGRDPFREKRLGFKAPPTPRPVKAEEGEGGDRVMIKKLREDWLEAALSYDSLKADQIFSDALARFTEEVASYEILLKALHDIGEGWYRGEISVQQEHFASSLAIRRIQALIVALPAPLRDEHIVVACSPGERHTFPSLLTTLFLRRQGYPVIYLGAEVPCQDMEGLLKMTSAKLVILSAHLLSTAAQNVDFAGRLIEKGVPVGYGGRIYNRLPPLQDRMPGYFLGEDLFHIESSVGAVLANPSLALKKKPSLPDHYASLLDAFNHHLNQIEGRVEEWGVREGLSSQHLAIAVERVSEGIQASLSLGAIDLLAHEWTWVKGYLSHRDISETDISTFLRVYAEGVEGELGEPGRVIADWLREESGRSK